MLWHVAPPQTSFQSSPGPRLEDFLALWCFLALMRRSLLDFWLDGLSAFGPSPGPSDGKRKKTVQVMDTLHLLWRRLGGHGIASGLDNGIKQTAVAAAGIVALLATVVGMDNEASGLLGEVAGPFDLAVDCCRDVGQQGVEGHL